jgi:hypothetical protein
MKRQFDKEKHITTFKQIKSFDEMLETKTSNIVYTENDGFGIVCYGGRTFVTKHKTFLHKHVYYNLHNSVCESAIINRDNFNNSGFTFYKRETIVEYENKKFKQDEFVEKVYLGD